MAYYGMTREERFYKNIKVKFIQVFDKRVVRELSKLNKYLYSYGETEHYRTKEKVTCWEYEWAPELMEDIKKIREELKNKKVGGRNDNRNWRK